VKTRFVVEVLAALVVLCAVLTVAWFSQRQACSPAQELSSCDRPVEMTGPTEGVMLWCNRDETTLVSLLHRLGCPDCEQAVLQLVADKPGPFSFRLATDCSFSALRPVLSGATSLMLGLPIDVNLAARRDLEELPGIGPVLARKIVQERTNNGPFCSIDELQRVSGIGPGIVAGIRESVATNCRQDTSTGNP
jgi:competence ComEA-like helix-hairpin-helix protein